MLTDLNLTDMETCYKMVRAPLMKSLVLTSDRFGFEPEITARLAQAQARIWELPISYNGRTYAEGKKIGWKDGVAAFFHILRFNLFPPKRPDQHRVPERRRSAVLAVLALAALAFLPLVNWIPGAPECRLVHGRRLELVERHDHRRRLRRRPGHRLTRVHCDVADPRRRSRWSTGGKALPWLGPCAGGAACAARLPRWWPPRCWVAGRC